MISVNSEEEEEEGIIMRAELTGRHSAVTVAVSSQQSAVGICSMLYSDYCYIMTDYISV